MTHARTKSEAKSQDPVKLAAEVMKNLERLKACLADDVGLVPYCVTISGRVISCNEVNFAEKSGRDAYWASPRYWMARLATYPAPLLIHKATPFLNSVFYDQWVHGLVSAAAEHALTLLAKRGSKAH